MKPDTEANEEQDGNIQQPQEGNAEGKKCGKWTEEEMDEVEPYPFPEVNEDVQVRVVQIERRSAYG